MSTSLKCVQSESILELLLEQPGKRPLFLLALVFIGWSLENISSERGPPALAVELRFEPQSLAPKGSTASKYTTFLATSPGSPRASVSWV